MKSHILAQVDEAQRLPSERHRVAIGLLRIALQHLCLGLAEWVVAHGVLNVLPAAKAALVQLRAPSDGTLVEALSELIVAAENSQWHGISRPLWARIEAGRPALNLGGTTLYELLSAAVFARNDGVEGHGIPGDEDPDALLDLVRLLGERLTCWPAKSAGDSLTVRSPDGRSIAMQLLRTFGGDAVCYRRIKRIRGARCRVDAQRQTSLLTRDDVTWEADDVLRQGEHAGEPAYDFWTTADAAWTPVVLLPERLTDTFTGRKEKFSELLNWYNDLDSWACMVFGDGGVGKTTLILEFLHRVLEGSIPGVMWKPSLISYFTAKQTIWGLQGLEQVSAGNLTTVDVCRSIVHAWDGVPPGKDWFSVDTSAAVDRLGTFLRDRMGITRKDHLIILDNTETLATTEEEVRGLRQQIERFTKRVGRVLLTSRRFEQIQAQSIELPPLPIEDAVGLLRLRATALNLQSIQTAGESSLRKFAEQLGRRPLVLEVFLQTIASEPGIGLQRAFDRVQRMQRQDLGEFLYRDAWDRLLPQTRHLMLLMARVANVLDEVLVKLCCAEVDTSVMAAYDALGASRGIATLPKVAGETQVVFHPDFLLFCRDRTVTVGNRDLPTDDAVRKVRRRYEEFLRARAMQVKDRVSNAFRKPFAKLAYQAYQDGQLSECEEYYELAVIEDPENGLLFDRYAMFLKMRGRNQEGLGKSIRATDLAPNDPETWFTRGMLETRVGQFSTAFVSFERARSLGKPVHLVLMQQAHAYLRMTPPDFPKASQALDASEAATPLKGDGFLDRHRDEVRNLRHRIRVLRRTGDGS